MATTPVSPRSETTATVKRPLGTPLPMGLLALAAAAFVTAGLHSDGRPPLTGMPSPQS
ncbi:hypothetical protein [Streptomyces sp. NPDC055055]